MGLKIFLSLVFIIVVLALLILYWFIPFSQTEFLINSQSPNFSIKVNEEKLQFYDNMRFPSSEISYKIEDCTLQKTQNMLGAFEVISANTILNFYEVAKNEQITIYCDSKNKIEQGLFIAGEGGPTNITKAGEFNIITHGKILLIKESTCPKPNIAIHELLHVLGFDHVADPNNIMYEISRCNQEISPTTIDLINLLYAIPENPDLLFEDAYAIMNGKYLDINISIRNNGFADAPETKLIIYADNSAVKEFPIETLKIGHGRIISLTNIWVGQISVNTIKAEIKTSFNELKKENNEILLKVKNKD